MLINLIYTILIKDLENNSLRRILFLCNDNYIHTVWFYNEKFKILEVLDIPKDFPKSIDLENFNSFTLIISELKFENKYLKSDTINNMENVDMSPKKNKINSDFNRKYSTLTSRSNNLVRNFSTFRTTKSDQKIFPKDINYNKSVFLILEKIKELTEGKTYNPKEVQLKIENFWTDIIKEKYEANNYKAIQDLQPKIY